MISVARNSYFFGVLLLHKHLRVAHINVGKKYSISKRKQQLTYDGAYPRPKTSLFAWYWKGNYLNCLQSSTSPGPLPTDMLHKYGQMHEFWRPIKLLRRLLTATSPPCLSHGSQSLRSGAKQLCGFTLVMDCWFYTWVGTTAERDLSMMSLVMMMMIWWDSEMCWVGPLIVTRSSTPEDAT